MIAAALNALGQRYRVARARFFKPSLPEGFNPDTTAIKPDNSVNVWVTPIARDGKTEHVGLGFKFVDAPRLALASPDCQHHSLVGIKPPKSVFIKKKLKKKTIKRIRKGIKRLLKGKA